MFGRTKIPAFIKIKFLTSVVGHTFRANGDRSGEFSIGVGEIRDWPGDEALRFIEGGMAEEWTIEKAQAAAMKAFEGAK
jgi:hypothetical protein